MRVAYQDRRHAGRVLVDDLRHVTSEKAVVLGLPRGGVVIAAEVAAALGAPMDVLVVRKLGVPWHPELGMGAIAEGGVLALNQSVIKSAGMSEGDIEGVRRQEEAELKRRAEVYRRGRPPVALTEKTALIVDDGLATGYTARAGVASARAQGAARIVLAVPVGAPDTVAALSQVADEVVCPLQPANFYAVGQWYQHFDQTTDEEVIRLLGNGETR
jgi:putative phosphoribosyl transferase